MPTVVPPALFAPLPPGWHVSTSAPILLVRGLGQAETVATSWRANLAAPDGWDGELHGARIAVHVLLYARPCVVEARTPVLQRPLELAGSTHARSEDLTRAEDRLAGRVDGYDVDLRVDYGVSHPSPALRARAQRVLAALRLPAWPERC